MLPTKNAAEEIGQRLPGDSDGHPRRVGPSVTDRDVKVAVGTELHHPPVVIGGLLGERDQATAARSSQCRRESQPGGYIGENLLA
jgi:hypothetical protein